MKVKADTTAGFHGKRATNLSPSKATKHWKTLRKISVRKAHTLVVVALRVQCSDEGSPDILLSVGTEPQPTLVPAELTGDSRNMLSPSECI